MATEVPDVGMPPYNRMPTANVGMAPPHWQCQWHTARTNHSSTSHPWNRPPRYAKTTSRLSTS